MIRFQSINPEKEGLTVKLESDVKNKIQMVTLPEESYKLWAEALRAEKLTGLTTKLT